MIDEVSYGVGEGPAANVSVSLHSGTIAAVRARVGMRGFSAYADAAVQRQIERDNLAELTAAPDAEHGTLAEGGVGNAA
ncbi:hypothetical protein [Streptomyces sp. NPDC058595]|uniref:hypothetical protein n=1 Tax=Streptomyces sp. NPDC058595 TaxID=3346550 RepID=UPI003669CA06